MTKPAFYSPELATEICTRLASGRSLRDVCESEDMPSRESVRRWRNEHEDFSKAYDAALHERTDAMLEDMLAVADDKSLDPHDKKVRIATRQWIMARMAPKRFGDRVEVAGDPERPLLATEPTDLARRVAFMLASGAARAKPDEREL